MANSKYSAQEVITGALKWAKMIAETDKYTYKRWRGDPKTHMCPICHPGSGNGWNCIGFVTACYYHGGGLRGNLECYCGGLGPDEWNNTDPGTKKWNDHNGPGWEKINKDGRIKALSNNFKKSCNPGDVIILYKTKSGNSYIHTAMYYGWSDKSKTALIAESSSGNPNGTKVQYCRKNHYSDWYMNVYRFVGPGSSNNKKPYTNSSISVPTVIASSSSTCTLKKIKKSTNSQEVIDGAIAWAKAIAKDPNFHYGSGKHAHHNGCYFCGTQHLKKDHGIKDYQYTYCCNPFITAAYAHGGGDPGALAKCKKNSSYCYDARPPASSWKKLNNPSIGDLKPGDVMISPRHVKMYIGDREVIHAHSSDDNKKNSKAWKNSISITSCNSVGSFIVYRYTGKGGGWITLPTYNTYNDNIDTSDKEIVDEGQGINLEKEISKLYNSQNYEYYSPEANNENESISKFKDSIQKALDAQFISVSSKNTNAAMEFVVDKAIKELNYNYEFDKNKAQRLKNAQTTNLVSYPSLVQAPLIMLDFNGIIIGGYGNRGDKYPNYIDSMSVKKINGRINQYSFNLNYQIRPGEDPNFIDKLISRTGYQKPLKILYGDSTYPTGFFRDEEAVIIDVKHREDPSSCRITYNISAISSLGIAKSSSTFIPVIDKPSSQIYKLLYNSGETSEALLSAFPGMKDKRLVASRGLIPSTDSTVSIGGLTNASPLSQLTHLVSCMKSAAGFKSSYYITFCEDNSMNGSYFKITEVKKLNSNDLSSTDSSIYTVDINYPTDNFITNFQVCSNDYWTMAYDFAGNIPCYNYDMDNLGNIIQTKTNIVYKNQNTNVSSLVKENWWTHATEFPIATKLTLKGLVTPAMLMSYIYINAYFYGQRDIASGLYVVTEENDTISGAGYTTELTLLRVAED